MKAKDYQDAMAIYAQADQRATAALIELVAATVLRKLAQPEGGAVVTVALSPVDLDETVSDFYVEAQYGLDDTMTLFLTRLSK